MHQKKFLFVSKDSLSGDLAMSLVKEGHAVKIFFSDRYSQDVYRGLLNKVHEWRKYIHWADVIVFDDENFGKHADTLRRRNKPIVGGSLYTDRLETDREFGQKELEYYGIKVLPRWNFDDYEKAIRFIRNHPDRYVFKPTGDGQAGYKGIVIIAQESDGKDLLEFLKQNSKVLSRKAPHFLLQKFADGIEVAVGAFFNGKNFISPINVNFEHKRFFHSNLGPLTGEAGTLMYWTETNILFQQTLLKLLPALQKCGYRGYIDINCIVGRDAIYPLEFTSRFGYPTIQIQLEGMKSKSGEWLSRLAHGEDFTMNVKSGFQIGVVIFTPPALSEGDNNETVEMYRNLAINFKSKKSLAGIHIGDIKKDHKGIWRIAGNSGWNLVVTGSGDTVDRAREVAYRRVGNIQIPNMFYRSDIGENWRIVGDQLRTWGYI